MSTNQEATIEYTPDPGPRRRVRFVLADDEDGIDAWRIEQVWDGTRWREIGDREPVRNLVVVDGDRA